MSVALATSQILTGDLAYRQVPSPEVVEMVQKGVRPTLPADTPMEYADLASRCGPRFDEN